MPKALGSGMAFRIVRGSAALVLVAGVFHPATATAAVGTTFYVGTNTDENDGGDCTNNANTDCSLRDAIIAANSNTNPTEEDTIEVPGATGSEFDLTLGTNAEGPNGVDATLGDLDVTQSVKIDGASQTIDASLLVDAGNDNAPAPDRVFHVTTPGSDQTRLTLSNLNVTGGATSGNGAGIANAGSYVELDVTSVHTNDAFGVGGGIYGGGAILAATTILDNTIVSFNLAGNSTQAGGGIYNSEGDSLTLRDGSYVIGNGACAHDTSGCDGTEEGDGGGIWNAGTASLLATTVDENQAGQHGGGIYNSETGTLTIGNGPLVEAGGDMDSTITNNFAGVDGGGIWNAGHTEMTDGGVGGPGDGDGNVAIGEGGGIWTLGNIPDTLLLTDTVVQDNIAGSHGGGIYNEGDRVVLDGTDVLGNEAGVVCGDGCNYPGGNGGGIWSSAQLDESESPPGLYLEGESTVSGNIAKACDSGEFLCAEGESGLGGGIYNAGHAEVTDGSVVGTTDPNNFSDANTAEDEGGGIWTGSERSLTLIVEDSAVDGNFSNTHGGGIYNEGDRVEIIDGSEVSGNTAGIGDPCGECGFVGGNGGGIWSNAQAFEQDDLPGGLYVRDSEISGNTALACESDCASGETGLGGGIWNSGHADLSDNTHVDDNVAQGGGGGIWTSQFGVCPCSLLVTDSTVSRNTAAFEGGGIWNSFDEVRLLRTTIDRNRAGVLVTFGEGGPEEEVIGGSGGGIWSGGFDDNELGSSLFVDHSAVTRNEAPGPPSMIGAGGGGIWNGGRAEVENTTISRNTTDGRGGGFYALGSESSGAGLLSSTIAFNHADSGGGGVAVGVDAGLPHLFLHNSIVANNTRTVDADPTVSSDCVEDLEGEIVSQDYNIDTDDSCNLTEPNDKPAMDPLLDPNLSLNGGTTENHALQTGSPAIDTGSPQTPAFPDGPACPDDDQRGVSRPQGAGCDRGAYEFQPGGGGGGGSPSADLSIVKTASPESVETGEHIVYTLTVENLGPDAASNVVVTDVLPASESFVSVNTTKGSCSHASGTVTCELGSLAKDEIVTITIEVIAGEPGTVVNSATVTGTNDPTQPNNSSSASTTVGAALTEEECAGFENDPRDQILGTPAADILIGTAADEVICGLASDDIIRGGGGDDLLLGEGGDDLLNGGPGDDTLNGGEGSDTGDYLDNPTPIDADLKAGIVHGASTDTVIGVENLIGSQFADVMRGDAGANSLRGLNGPDLIKGRKGADQLRGNRGKDALGGGRGPDLVRGGKSRDRVRGGRGRDLVTGGSNDDVVRGNKGKDQLRGGGGDDELNGGAGTDSCNGGSGSNTLVSCET